MYGGRVLVGPLCNKIKIKPKFKEMEYIKILNSHVYLRIMALIRRNSEKNKNLNSECEHSDVFLRTCLAFFKDPHQSLL